MQYMNSTVLKRLNPKRAILCDEWSLPPWNPVVAILRNKPVIGQKMRVRLMDAADLAAAGLTGENAPEGPVYMAFGDYMEICT